MIEQIKIALDRIEAADAIVISASNGLSIAEGINIFAENEDFIKHFGEFRNRYGFRSIIKGCFHSFPTEPEKWAFFSKMYSYFFHNKTSSNVMNNLHSLVKNKPHFVVTSNIDAHFHLANFNPDHILEIEGNCRNLQCASLCHDHLYSGDQILSDMAQQVQNGKIPEKLIPSCPKCNGLMQVHIEVDHMFLRGKEWQAHQNAFNHFLHEIRGKKIVFLELGIGARNQLIKAPIMQLVDREPLASYICCNLGMELYIPNKIANKSIGINGDIAQVLNQFSTLAS